uniref:Uncharacterized protein n=1 Tax=Lepeophtheirus salmonis TaxID=72036 RepID=A0A0K2UCV0_LEPSM
MSKSLNIFIESSDIIQARFKSITIICYRYVSVRGFLSPQYTSYGVQVKSPVFDCEIVFKIWTQVQLESQVSSPSSHL